MGLAAGLRHALEPDHLAAVSTFVSSSRGAPMGGSNQEDVRPGRSPIGYAAAWGLGHGVVLLGVGATLFALRTSMPARVSDAFELVVALMLVGLGARGLRLARNRGHSHGAGDDVRPPVKAGTTRMLAFVVGITHGLAGSGAVAAGVAAGQPSAWLGLLTIGLYGAGAALGMVGLGALVAISVGRATDRAERVLATVGWTTSAASLVLGFVWGWPILQRLLA